MVKRIIFLFAISWNALICIGQEPIDITKLYNNAIIAYETDDIGTAVYNLELANMIHPRDKEITNNLRLARNKVPVDIVTIEGFFLNRWLNSISSVFNPGIWKYLSLFFTLLLIGLLYFKLIEKRDEKIYSNLSLGILGFCFLLTVVFGLHTDNVLKGGKYAIIMDKDVISLKEGPDMVSEDIKEVSVGVKVEILDSFEDWYKVSAMDREQGWLKKSAIKILTTNTQN